MKVTDTVFASNRIYNRNYQLDEMVFVMDTAINLHTPIPCSQVLLDKVYFPGGGGFLVTSDPKGTLVLPRIGYS